MSSFLASTLNRFFNLYSSCAFHTFQKSQSRHIWLHQYLVYITYVTFCIFFVITPALLFWLERRMWWQTETSLTSNLSPSRKAKAKHAWQSNNISLLSNHRPSRKEGGKHAKQRKTSLTPNVKSLSQGWRETRMMERLGWRLNQGPIARQHTGRVITGNVQNPYHMMFFAEHILPWKASCLL